MDPDQDDCRILGLVNDTIGTRNTNWTEQEETEETEVEDFKLKSRIVVTSPDRCQSDNIPYEFKFLSLCFLR